jgi:iron-sulfur cluster repair protein YtfE (RIC family)
MLRRDLSIVRELADRVESGLPAEELRTELRSLQTTGPLWQLRVSCLQYCRFVHGHHRLEDIALFPAIRRSDPGLGSVVDRLQADHRRVSELLEEVEESAGELSEAGGPDGRARVTAALRELEQHLLQHLDFEEESVGPAIRRWEDIPLR